MFKNELEEVFGVLSQVEGAMPQPVGGSSLTPSGLSFRDELTEAVQRLKSRGTDLPAVAEDPTTWV